MSAEVERARAKFSEATKAHGQALENGDHKAANRAYALTHKAARVLQQSADHGEAVFLEMLKGDCHSTRKTAALFLLNLREREAIEALEEVARRGGPLVSFDAEMILSEWRNGSLQAP